MDRKIKILLVEDEVLIAQCLKMELEIAGYNVCNFVAKGEEAIIVAKNEEPDLLLMDIHLSGKMDGIDAAKKIIEHRNIPVIFMTGYNEVAILEKANSINPAGYLEKPVELFELKPIIDSIFK